uniref:Dynamin-type G domain-containing protein n=1 Tax=Macrostomum lignano TaxID=282301 RepID=A0A1I8FW14_9PLAT
MRSKPTGDWTGRISPDATETVSLSAAADASKTFTPALSQQYRERIRPVLNSIDRLRSHGLQNELRLPTVAVVGDQSVGKSSVLEAISGGEHVEREISKKCEVDEMVRKVQNEITGDSNGVSTEQIDLTIESADVSDLTLVDLPGIARYSEKNPKINEVTKQLILSYISQDQVIILVVVPCSVDIETVEAIALAKQVDPGGTRTIGVLTCPDLTNPGSEEDIKAIVNNQGRVRLHKGFVMVKCRSPKELRNNISLSEVAKIEEDYFKNDPHFSQLPKDIVGTKTLAEKLTNELFKAVAAGIETLEESLKSKLKDYEEELKDLEDSLCETDSDKRAYLMRKLQQFASKVHAATASPEDERDAFATGSSSSLYSSCLTNCSSFGYLLPNGVSDEVQLRRGRELPTFTFVFPVVQKIVFEEYLPKIEYLAKWLLGEVQSQVTKSLENLTENCFKAFPRLLLLVKETVVKAIEAQEAECRADLAKLIAHERRLFTQDSQFSEKLRYVTEQQKELAKQPVPPPTLFSGFGAPAASQPIRISREPQASPTTRASQGGFKRAEPQVSRASSEPSHEEQIRLGTKAYLLLACQRISDTVPMSVLCHMLDGVATKLVAEITRLFAGGSHQVDILDLLREKEGRQRRRRYLIQAAFATPGRGWASVPGLHCGSSSGAASALGSLRIRRPAVSACQPSRSNCSLAFDLWLKWMGAAEALPCAAYVLYKPEMSSRSSPNLSSNKRQHKSSDGPTPAKQVKSPDATETVSLSAAADASKTFTPALSQQYRERIRPVLNSIDRLRSHGLQNELRLPTVAVVGDQSVGKSSVLEAISGVDLPRGSGIVTRCPLQLSMRSKPTGDWTGRISYQNRKGEHVEREISKKCEVDEMVRKVQNEITGDSNGVSTEQIDLTIESADVSDLTLVDLPGIARYSEKNPKINEVTKQLILSYISQDQVIILVVVPCSVDIETVEAIALAKQVDPGGTRTIGVLTCPDLTNPGSEEDIKAIVNNQGRVRLHKGFVMVKCRSPKELRNNISLSEVAKIEEDYFKNDPHFSQLPKDIVGTKTLAEKLTNELFKAVAAGIETLEESLKSKLKDYEEELKDLEDSLCETDSDKRAYLMRKLQQFASKVHAATASPEDERDAFATGSSSSLYSSCLTNCSSFGYSVSRSQPAWIIDYSKSVPNYVSDEVQLRRGRELPTFTFVFPVVQKIVFEEYLPKIENLAKWLLDNVQSKVTKTLENLAENCFKAFPRLLLLVKETVVKAIEAQEAECRTDMAKLIAHERRLFTQDSQFSEKLSYVTTQWQEFLATHRTPQ